MIWLYLSKKNCITVLGDIVVFSSAKSFCTETRNFVQIRILYYLIVINTFTQASQKIESKPEFSLSGNQGQPHSLCALGVSFAQEDLCLAYQKTNGKVIDQTIIMQRKNLASNISMFQEHTFGFKPILLLCQRKKKSK